MTRSVAEIDRVLALSAEGHNQCEIACSTGVPRRTINDWVNGKVPSKSGGDQGASCRGCQSGLELLEPRFGDYAYVLAMYLGDGCISKGPRGVYRLRITLDCRYPAIVRECAGAVSAIIHMNRVSVYQHPNENVDEVSVFWKHLPCVFPQHGAGPKHQRTIELLDWQREIVDRHPWRFLRGLIHSDGCRFINPVRHPKKTYRYPRYNFTNRSDDIRRLFCDTCDAVGVDWRQMNRWNISVARRHSVALMDRYIGPKR
jgi:hypothetical protein